MDAAVLIARLLLAAVFGLAAVTKLRDRDAAARAIDALGAPRRFARPGAVVLPVLEIGIAGGLLVAPIAQAAAVLAFALLGLFTAAITAALRRSRRPDCGCFGNLSAKPVSGWTVGRNVALMGIALFVVVRGPGESLAAALELLIVIVAVAGGVLVGRLRSVPTKELSLSPLSITPLERRGIEIGLPAPNFELSGACGGAASLASLRNGGLPVVVLFLDGGCGACRQLHPDLHRWQVTLAERVAIAVVMTGGEEMAHTLCTEHAVENVLVDESAEPLWEAYRMPGTPSGVAVAPDGSIASASVHGPDALEELVRQTVRRGAQTSDAWKLPAPVA